VVAPYPIPDAEKKKRKGSLWCPYCGEWRIFRRRDGYQRCEVCGITTREWYVKKANNLWERGSVKPNCWGRDISLAAD
jgi:hypothetical protein